MLAGAGKGVQIDKKVALKMKDAASKLAKLALATLDDASFQAPAGSAFDSFLPLPLQKLRAR